jgi:hypothetical protein
MSKLTGLQWTRRHDAEVALPRLLHRLRGQGADVAGAHLAADAAAAATPGDGDLARRRARQGRHLRDDPLLPAAVPGASQWATPVVIALALVSILYGALCAIGSDDLMRLIAYTSISHFGFIVWASSR